jgi:D123
MDFETLSCPCCQVIVSNSNWVFKIPKKIQFRTRLVSLPSLFIEYLNTDGIILPKIATPSNQMKRSDPRYSVSSIDGDISNYDEVIVEGQVISAASSYSFPALETILASTIDDLGGKVFIKTDWSAPLDAKWIMPGGSLSCSTSGEIFMLLKASDLSNYDLQMLKWIQEQLVGMTSTDASMFPTPSLHLILKPYFNLHRSGEFRAFVYDFVLRGVSQRHTSEYFSFLSEDKKLLIRDAITACYNTYILGALPLRSFVFDVYVDTNCKVWLMDVGPFGGDSESLLFNWSDFDEKYQTGEKCSYHLSNNVDSKSLPITNPESVEFRIVNDETRIQPEKFAHHAYPDDLLDLVSSTGLSLVEVMSSLERSELEQEE